MNLSLPTWKITLLISFFIAIFNNVSFWDSLTAIVSIKKEPLLIVSFFIIMVMLINLLLTLISFKPFFKILIITLLITSASAAYFMDNYAIMIDKSMIRNILATDINEANELFSFNLLLTILFFGILPSWGIATTSVKYQPLLKGLLHKSLISIICTGIIVGTVYCNYQELSFFGRNNRELRYLVNPTNYIFSLQSIITKSIAEGTIIIQPIENDAKKILAPEKQKKPSLIILVLGETARSMNFSLNGYDRNTNPLLAKQDIINFSNVSSCGTTTAVSVPCMFSKFIRENFNNSKGKKYENLLDVVNHAGYRVHWRDNNTGCQGICKRINFEDLTHNNTSIYCESGNCIDEILLHKLQKIVNKENGDMLIILHQKGNHGPTYHQRYPEKFEVFKPMCKTNQLRSCSQEEITNAYDNAILYTDYFISQSIEFLKGNSIDYNTAMIYISDHGESLGENNLYLHGLPYMIAPVQQKQVPFILWLSNGYQQTYEIDKSCISNKSANKLSHDNLFSSMLGLLAIQTKVYDKNLDIFASCNGLTGKSYKHKKLKKPYANYKD